MGSLTRHGRKSTDVINITNHIILRCFVSQYWDTEPTLILLNLPMLLLSDVFKMSAVENPYSAALDAN